MFCPPTHTTVGTPSSLLPGRGVEKCQVESRVKMYQDIPPPAPTSTAGIAAPPPPSPAPASNAILPPPSEQTYDNALASLFSPLHQSQTPEDIRRAAQRRTRTPADMRRYLSRISLPHDDSKFLHCQNIVHITGTKGKGSTAALCESILRNRDGKTTGLFTSPHLVDIRERIRVGGKPVSKELFGEAYWEIRRRLEGWREPRKDCADDDDDDDDLPFLPGYFRMLALMALFIFALYESPDGNKIDVVILEVGVGGRYDATNIFDHSITNTVCGVTLIDYDHTRVLGSRLSQIAWEKGGIFYSDKGRIVDVFTDDFDTTDHDNVTPRPSDTSEATDTSNLCNDPNNCEKFFTINTNPEEVINILRESAAREGNGQTVEMVKIGDAISPEWNVGLPGEHQRINAELAVALCNSLTKDIIRDSALSSCSTTSKTLEYALESTFWPGRCQSVQVKNKAGQIINLRCDGAHTPQSLATCLEWFRTVSGYDDGKENHRILIFNCSHERNPVPLLDMIQAINEPRNPGGQEIMHYSLFDQVYFCRADSERPSALKKASARELLVDAGILDGESFAETSESSSDVPTTWQETLAEIWMELAVRKGLDSSLLEVPCIVNVCVSDAISIIKQNIETDLMHTTSNNKEMGEVEICVTGSLYIVGSALNAAAFAETAADGKLNYNVPTLRS